MNLQEKLRKRREVEQRKLVERRKKMQNKFNTADKLEKQKEYISEEENIEEENTEESSLSTIFGATEFTLHNILPITITTLIIIFVGMFLLNNITESIEEVESENSNYTNDGLIKTITNILDKMPFVIFFISLIIIISFLFNITNRTM